jgi:hypothetical protein
MTYVAFATYYFYEGNSWSNTRTMIDIIYDIAVGLTMLHPGLRRIRGHRVILREKVNSFFYLFLYMI